MKFTGRPDLKLPGSRFAYRRRGFLEGGWADMHRAVLHPEARGVPGTHDLATICADPSALVEWTTGMGAGISHCVERAAQLDDEECDAIGSCPGRERASGCREVERCSLR
jgi:hypothetical protein